MTAALPPAAIPAGTRSWPAAIRLVFAKGPHRTDMVRCAHYGPLRVQRPFYPEGECCHCYLLHPPGGIAPGDDLRVDVSVQAGAEALLTTPSAGRVYRTDDAGTAQFQGVTAQVEEGACLEWLPQETIVFDGASVTLTNAFELAAEANLLAWEILVLGRRASGESYTSGRCLQHLQVRREGRWLLNERSEFNAGDPMLMAHWGMAGASVTATLLATVDTDLAARDRLRDGLAAFEFEGALWGLTQKPGVLICRYLGHSPEQARKGFAWLWSVLRPMMSGRAASPPRIWNT